MKAQKGLRWKEVEEVKVKYRTIRISAFVFVNLAWVVLMLGAISVLSSGGSALLIIVSLVMGLIAFLGLLGIAQLACLLLDVEHPTSKIAE